MDDFYLDFLDDKFLTQCSQIDYYLRLEEEQWEWEMKNETRKSKGSEDK